MAKTVKIPLVKGLGKSPKNQQWTAKIPVNMLYVPGAVLEDEGWLRPFPGMLELPRHIGSSAGNSLSHAVSVNHVDKCEWRFSGDSIARFDGVHSSRYAPLNYHVENTGRSAMPYSLNSQAFVAADKLLMYPYTIANPNYPYVLDNWPVSSGFPEYDIGFVVDACWHRGRYIWVKRETQTFGITDLEDETHPDRYRPFYSAETQPDNILGCLAWRDYVVMFGSSSIEFFSLTGETDPQQPVYITQPAMMVGVGISGTWCKTQFTEVIAIVGSKSGTAPGVFLVEPGNAVAISTIAIEKILAAYTAEELEKTHLESVHFDGHDLLLIYLPDRTLCYDATASQGNGPQWCELRSGLPVYPVYEDETDTSAHRHSTLFAGVDFSFFNGELTCADRNGGQVYRIVSDSLDHYTAENEFILYTPMVRADNAILSDLELELSSGVEYWHIDPDEFLPDRRWMELTVFVSATTDGVHYGQEHIISKGRQYHFDRRVRLARVGRVRKNVGFRFRIVARAPFAIAACSVRLD